VCACARARVYARVCVCGYECECACICVCAHWCVRECARVRACVSERHLGAADMEARPDIMILEVRQMWAVKCSDNHIIEEDRTRTQVHKMDTYSEGMYKHYPDVDG
jgi:hypothetical protein